MKHVCRLLLKQMPLHKTWLMEGSMSPLSQLLLFVHLGTFSSAHRSKLSLWWVWEAWHGCYWWRVASLAQRSGQAERSVFVGRDSLLFC